MLSSLYKWSQAWEASPLVFQPLGSVLAAYHLHAGCSQINTADWKDILANARGISINLALHCLEKHYVVFKKKKKHTNMLLLHQWKTECFKKFCVFSYYLFYFLKHNTALQSYSAWPDILFFLKFLLKNKAFSKYNVSLKMLLTNYTEITKTLCRYQSEYFKITVPIF